MLQHGSKEPICKDFWWVVVQVFTEPIKEIFLLIGNELCCCIRVIVELLKIHWIQEGRSENDS